MESDGVADDLGRCDEGVDLLNHYKDAHNAEDIAPLGEAPGLIRTLKRGDNTRGDQTENVSDVGNDSKKSHHDSDEETIVEAEEGEGDSDENSVDEGDQNLSSEE